MKSNLKSAFQFIILLGLVSCFGDIVYEGARSITGPFLAVLGASSAVVGIIAGVGEFLGYVLRLASGYLADKTRLYWPLTFLGYGALLSIPLLALAGNWEMAALLIILERIGKAIRTPARDTILSHATAQVGRGFGFGLHEALDQIGAILGPLAISAMLFITHGYRLGFALLFIPALLVLFFLIVAQRKCPTPVIFEARTKEGKKGMGKLPALFWIYVLFSFFSILGFVNFQLISYHFEVQSIISTAQIPIFYAIAMGVDAMVALIIGKLYDRIGLSCLFAIPLLTTLLPFFVFSHSYSIVLFSIILWGAIMGIHETIMRAAVADLTPLPRRATAYGIFNIIYGLAWLTGSSLIGLLYSISLELIIALVVASEVISMVFCWQLKKMSAKHFLNH